MKFQKINAVYDSVFNAAKTALLELNITIEISDKKNRTIVGSTSTTFLSWGEKIQINFQIINQFSTLVEVESTSTAQLVSWGKNSKNEEDILEKIIRIMGV